MTAVKSAFLLCTGKKDKKEFTVRGSRTIFKTNSSMSQTPNTMSVQVYGLDDGEMSNAINKAHTINLYAGQEFKEGVIGVGQVITAKVSSGQSGVFLDITTVDGDDFYSTPVNRSISAGISLDRLVRELVALSNTSVGIGQISKKTMGVALPRGFSVVGSPLQAIRNVAKSINAAFFINQGLIYLVCPDEMTGEVVTINQDDLLSDIVFDGYYAGFVSDINSLIRVGKSLMLPRTKANAPLYRVQRVTTEGDTKNPLWNMVVEGAEQTEIGFAQSAVTNSVWR